MICDREIEVLIQGGYSSETEICIESIKQVLPQALITVSTWQGREIEAEVDNCIYLNDPGEIFPCEKKTNLRNINRQIYGRYEGLKCCTRKYVLIIRSDSKIVNLNFVNAFEAEYERGRFSEYDYFEKRIVCCSAGNLKGKLYHLCDWFFFGLREDLVKLYKIPLFELNEQINLELPKYKTPHEYLTISFLEENSKFTYDYSTHNHKQEILKWRKIICENFITIGFYKDFGIVNLKEPYYSNQIKNEKNFMSGMMHLMRNFEFEDWANNYNKLYERHWPFKRRWKWRVSVAAVKIYRLFKPWKAV